MSIAARRLLLCLLLAGAGTMSAAAIPEGKPLEDQLIGFAQQLRIGMTLATVATYSPTIGDLRLHAQQLVNLLEGPHGKHYARPVSSDEPTAGLLIEAGAFGSRFQTRGLGSETRGRLAEATRNVRTYLSLALDASLSVLDERRMERASAAMMQAYAFLLAAYEQPCGVPYVPALWTILRAFDLTERVANAHREP